MKTWVKILRIIVFLIAGVLVIGFDALLYNFCEQQKTALNTLNDQQKVEIKVNSNRFKYQQDQIEHLSNDIDNIQQQIKGQNDDLASQKDALLQEAQKRQQIEDEGKSIQTSLVDIKAEADAIKQDMKGWQKDYVNVLAQLEKKMDDSQDEIKNVENNLVDLNIPALKENISSLKDDVEKLASPPATANALPDPLPVSDQKVNTTESNSQ